MKLPELLEGVETLAAVGVSAQAEIAGLAYNSRRVGAGFLFAAIQGGKHDGHDFIPQALERGARVILSDQPRPVGMNCGWVRVARVRRALAMIAANFYGHPARTLRLIGVTGTNGKTTTTFLIESILRAAGQAAGLLGTIEYRLPNGSTPASFTTPEAVDLQAFFADLRAAGGRYAVLEVSSHSLAMDRVYGCQFAAAVFTNLTQDHLDFHGTLENYFEAKKQLFLGTGAPPPGASILNADDPRYASLREACTDRVLSYGLVSQADVQAGKFEFTAAGLDFTVETPAGPVRVRSPLLGRPNAYNIVAAIATSVTLELPRPAIEDGIAHLQAVPGRFERVDEGQAFTVIVDYAHTDDALRNLIETARGLSPRRIITLFGCGGDRDRSKRPLMGEVAGRFSDLVLATSDNPRSEDPLRILNDVIVGLQRAQANYVVEPDRVRAIELALETARPGDMVLLAGKGHERGQILADSVIPHDDREQARAILRRMGHGRTVEAAARPS